MRVVVGMLMFGLGYVMVYYTVVMYRQYDSNASSNTQGIPFSVLVGMHGRDMLTENAPTYAGVPFKY